MKPERSDAESDSFATWTLWALGIVVVLWILFGLLAIFGRQIVGWISASAAESIEPGTFGDMFGAGNAFFSALAFAFVVITLRLQVKELKEARLDRKANLQHQEVIAKSQEAAAQMQRTLARSGDVYTAYSRVYGSFFVSRMDRLRWLERRVIAQAKAVEGLEYFATERLTAFFAADPSDIPAYYDPQVIGSSGDAEWHHRHGIAVQRVRRDIEECAGAVLDLWAAYSLELIGIEELCNHWHSIGVVLGQDLPTLRSWLGQIAGDSSSLPRNLVFVEQALDAEWRRFREEELGEDLSEE